MSQHSKTVFSATGWTILTAGILLCLISVALIFSANHASPDTDLQQIYLKQGIWLIIGLVAFVITVTMPLRFHEIFAYIYYAVIATLLVGLIMFGASKFGAQRWYAFGIINFQPSELAKLAFIIALARYLSYSKRSPSSWRKIIIATLICGGISLLVLRQPDLGTTIIFLFVFIVMMYWARLPGRFLLLFLSPFISMIASTSISGWVAFFVLLFIAIYVVRPSLRFGVVVVAVNLIVGALSSIVWNQLHDYQKMRIKIFLDPGQDPLGAGYQIIQSKVAIGSGGLFGKGFLAGSQSQLDFLPLRHTDFIFSVAGEEFGLLGALVIMALFVVIIALGINAAMKARSQFAGLVAIGATSVLAFQVIINIGMVVGLMPVTGLPLPLVSYGGSSMLLSWILLGLIVNVEKNWQEY